ncbi:high mobility group box domain-containing protein, partial [Lentinula raphanica]
DPNWVARPRNAFIIFRSGGKRGLLSTLDKTMSKRAGDAWKLLSRAQKAHYKQLADQEKKEHALAHPGYRYRP